MEILFFKIINSVQLNIFHLLLKKSINPFSYYLGYSKIYILPYRKTKLKSKRKKKSLMSTALKNWSIHLFFNLSNTCFKCPGTGPTGCSRNYLPSYYARPYFEIRNQNFPNRTGRWLFHEFQCSVQVGVQIVVVWRVD